MDYGRTKLTRRDESGLGGLSTRMGTINRAHGARAAAGTLVDCSCILLASEDFAALTVTQAGVEVWCRDVLRRHVTQVRVRWDFRVEISRTSCGAAKAAMEYVMSLRWPERDAATAIPSESVRSDCGIPGLLGTRKRRIHRPLRLVRCHGPRPSKAGSCWAVGSMRVPATDVATIPGSEPKGAGCGQVRLPEVSIFLPSPAYDHRRSHERKSQGG